MNKLATQTKTKTDLLLAQYIEYQRKQLGLTQTQLGQRTGLSKETIVAIESRRANITISTICALTTFFRIELTDLFGAVNVRITENHPIVNKNRLIKNILLQKQDDINAGKCLNINCLRNGKERTAAFGKIVSVIEFDFCHDGNKIYSEYEDIDHFLFVLGFVNELGEFDYQGFINQYFPKGKNFVGGLLLVEWE